MNSPLEGWISLKGFDDRVLKIDLKRKTFTEKVLLDAIHETYLGGGEELGSYLRMKVNPAGIDPHSLRTSSSSVLVQLWTVGCMVAVALASIRNLHRPGSFWNPTREERLLNLEHPEK